MASHIGDLEETCLEKDYSVILAKIVSAFWRKRSALLEKTVWRFWRFGELYLAKSWSVIWRNRSAILEKTVRRFWRFGEILFGEIVVGDLEKSIGDFGDLEIVMEYRNARRPYVKIEK